MRKASICPRPNSKFSKMVWFKLRVKTVSARDRHWRNSRKGKWESAAVWRMRVGIDSLLSSILATSTDLKKNQFRLRLFWDFGADQPLQLCRKSLSKTCGNWILFRSVEDAEIEAVGELFPTPIPQSVSDWVFNIFHQTLIILSFEGRQ